MRGIILAYSLHDYTSPLKAGDLVYIHEEFEEYYELIKVDPRHGRYEHESDTQYPYIVKTKYNHSIYDCFSREEISKANVAFFDHEKWYRHGKMVMLGAISAADLTYIKAKYANEWEMAWSEFDKIHAHDLVGLDFDGDVVEQELHYDTVPGADKTVIKYFRINKPE